MRSSLEARGASHSFGLGLGFGGWSRKFHFFLCRPFSSSSGTDCWNAFQAEALGKGPGDGILPPFNHPISPLLDVLALGLLGWVENFGLEAEDCGVLLQAVE